MCIYMYMYVYVYMYISMCMYMHIPIVQKDKPATNDFADLIFFSIVEWYLVVQSTKSAGSEPSSKSWPNWKEWHKVPWKGIAMKDIK